MKALIGIVLLALASNLALARNIYLNGKDISSAKGQKLDKVNLFISENGDIFITAPQYQVYEEKTFQPIAKRLNNNIKNSHPEVLNGISETIPGLPVSKAVELPEEGTIDTQEFKEKAGTRFID